MFKAEAKKISDLFNRKVMSVPRNQENMFGIRQIGKICFRT